MDETEVDVWRNRWLWLFQEYKCLKRELQETKAELQETRAELYSKENI